MYPKIVGLLLEGLPKMGPLISGNTHIEMIGNLQKKMVLVVRGSPQSSRSALMSQRASEGLGCC